MPVDPDQTVYVSAQKLQSPRSGGGPPMWHPDEDCYKLEEMNSVEEMPAWEAREKCARQASCCRYSDIPTLEEAP